MNRIFGDPIITLWCRALRCTGICFGKADSNSHPLPMWVESCLFLIRLEQRLLRNDNKCIIYSLSLKTLRVDFLR